MNKLMKFSFVALLFIGFTACSDDDDSTTQQSTAHMSVKLTDAPGDYDAVFIDVQDIVVKYNGSGEEIAIGEINAGVYDLLELTGGVSVLLVDDEIPTGNLNQIRLILGENNTIVVDGQTFPLTTPSAQQSGLKIQVNETLEDDIFYEFILDFDVEESIVTTGNGGYILKPVIRASLAAESGSISGNVLPAGVQTLISAENNDTQISAYANEAGEFVLNGVPNGTYTVTIQADLILGLPAVTIENVTVVQGEITALGTIELNP